MRIIKAAFRIIIGVIFGVGSAVALIPAFAAFTSDSDKATPVIMLVLVLLCGTLGFFAPTVRRAFGRGFLLLGSSVFALPISVFLLSARAASEVISAAEAGAEAATTIGAGIGGIAMTGLATFVGLILGAILLIIGLVLSLGGRREVIIVEQTRRRDPKTFEGL